VGRAALLLAALIAGPAEGQPTPAPPALLEAPRGIATGSTAPASPLSWVPLPPSQAASTGDDAPPSLHGGRATRLVTPRGPVHLWIPRGYARASAATIVYVHGYFVDADGAVRAHRLFDAFARSRRNALFVVPEAPSSRADEVRTPALGPLVRESCAGARLGVPDGPWIAVGHSGGYRTLSGWLDEPRLDVVVLLDAAYGDVGPFTRWGQGRERRLIVVSSLTREKSRAIVGAFAAPRTIVDWPSRVLPRGPAIVHAESALEHGALVERPEVLGALLARLPAPPVDAEAAPQ
jgi:hypothetical protein